MLESTIRLKTVLNHRLEADKKLYKALRTLIKQYYKKNIPIDKACYELLIGSLKHLEEHSKMDKSTSTKPTNKKNQLLTVKIKTSDDIICKFN